MVKVEFGSPHRRTFPNKAFHSILNLFLHISSCDAIKCQISKPQVYSYCDCFKQSAHKGRGSL